MLAPLHVLLCAFHQLILTDTPSVKYELLHTQLIDTLQMKELKHGLIILRNEQPTYLMIMRTELGSRKHSSKPRSPCTALLTQSGESS